MEQPNWTWQRAAVPIPVRRAGDRSGGVIVALFQHWRSGIHFWLDCTDKLTSNSPYISPPLSAPSFGSSSVKLSHVRSVVRYCKQTFAAIPAVIIASCSDAAEYANRVPFGNARLGSVCISRMRIPRMCCLMAIHLHHRFDVLASGCL